MNGFTPEDFKHLAERLRETDDVAAVMSNNFNVILAALDRCARSDDEEIAALLENLASWESELHRVATERDQLQRAHRMVTVCDSCLQASCWQGVFFCEDYLNAGTVDLPVAALEQLAREHPDYWREK